MGRLKPAQPVIRRGTIHRALQYFCPRARRPVASCSGRSFAAFARLSSLAAAPPPTLLDSIGAFFALAFLFLWFRLRRMRPATPLPCSGGGIYPDLVGTPPFSASPVAADLSPLLLAWGGHASRFLPGRSVPFSWPLYRRHFHFRLPAVPGTCFLFSRLP